MQWRDTFSTFWADQFWRDTLEDMRDCGNCEFEDACLSLQRTLMNEKKRKHANYFDVNTHAQLSRATWIRSRVNAIIFESEPL